MPTELLAGAASAEHWRNVAQDGVVARGERCRIEALKAIADLEADEALRGSILRRSANREERDFSAGRRVAA